MVRALTSKQEIEQFCKIECKLQGRPTQWRSMVRAWKYAQEYEGLTLPMITHLAHLVEKTKNRDRWWRECNVGVGTSLKPPHSSVEHLMRAWDEWLMEALPTPEEAFFLFETIHPFRDGNGRVGQIIYNVLKGTLDHPEMAPDYWGDWRRSGMQGRGWLLPTEPDDNPARSLAVALAASDARFRL